MKFPAELKMKLKKTVQGHAPKARPPNSNPSLNKDFHILREKTLWRMDSRVQENNRRRRHEVGVAVTDHGFPATFIKDGLGSGSMERTPKAGASGARKDTRKDWHFHNIENYSRNANTQVRTTSGFPLIFLKCV